MKIVKYFRLLFPLRQPNNSTQQLAHLSGYDDGDDISKTKQNVLLSEQYLTTNKITVDSITQEKLILEQVSSGNMKMGRNRKRRKICTQRSANFKLKLLKLSDEKVNPDGVLVSEYCMVREKVNSKEKEGLKPSTVRKSQSRMSRKKLFELLDNRPPPQGKVDPEGVTKIGKKEWTKSREFVFRCQCGPNPTEIILKRAAPFQSKSRKGLQARPRRGKSGIKEVLGPLVVNYLKKNVSSFRKFVDEVSDTDPNSREIIDNIIVAIRNEATKNKCALGERDPLLQVTTLESPAVNHPQNPTTQTVPHFARKEASNFTIAKKNIIEEKSNNCIALLEQQIYSMSINNYRGSGVIKSSGIPKPKQLKFQASLLDVKMKEPVLETSNSSKNDTTVSKEKKSRFKKRSGTEHRPNKKKIKRAKFLSDNFVQSSNFVKLCSIDFIPRCPLQVCQLRRRIFTDNNGGYGVSLEKVVDPGSETKKEVTEFATNKKEDENKCKSDQLLQSPEEVFKNETTVAEIETLRQNRPDDDDEESANSLEHNTLESREGLIVLNDKNGQQGLINYDYVKVMNNYFDRETREANKTTTKITLLLKNYLSLFSKRSNIIQPVKPMNNFYCSISLPEDNLLHEKYDFLLNCHCDSDIEEIKYFSFTQDLIKKYYGINKVKQMPRCHNNPPSADFKMNKFYFGVLSSNKENNQLMEKGRYCFKQGFHKPLLAEFQSDNSVNNLASIVYSSKRAEPLFKIRKKPCVSINSSSGSIEEMMRSISLSIWEHLSQFSVELSNVFQNATSAVNVPKTPKKSSTVFPRNFGDIRVTDQCIQGIRFKYVCSHFPHKSLVFDNSLYRLFSKRKVNVSKSNFNESQKLNCRNKNNKPFSRTKIIVSPVDNDSKIKNSKKLLLLKKNISSSQITYVRKTEDKPEINENNDQNLTRPPVLNNFKQKIKNEVSIKINELANAGEEIGKASDEGPTDVHDLPFVKNKISDGLNEGSNVSKICLRGIQSSINRQTQRTEKSVTFVELNKYPLGEPFCTIDCSSLCLKSNFSSALLVNMNLNKSKNKKFPKTQLSNPSKAILFSSASAPKHSTEIERAKISSSAPPSILFDSADTPPLSAKTKMISHISACRMPLVSAPRGNEGSTISKYVLSPQDSETIVIPLDFTKSLSPMLTTNDICTKKCSGQQCPNIDIESSLVKKPLPSSSWYSPLRQSSDHRLKQRLIVSPFTTPVTSYGRFSSILFKRVPSTSNIVDLTVAGPSLLRLLSVDNIVASSKLGNILNSAVLTPSETKTLPSPAVTPTLTAGCLRSSITNCTRVIASDEKLDTCVNSENSLDKRSVPTKNCITANATTALRPPLLSNALFPDVSSTKWCCGISPLHNACINRRRTCRQSTTELKCTKNYNFENKQRIRLSDTNIFIIKTPSAKQRSGATSTNVNSDDENKDDLSLCISTCFTTYNPNQSLYPESININEPSLYLSSSINNLTPSPEAPAPIPPIVSSSSVLPSSLKSLEAPKIPSPDSSTLSSSLPSYSVISPEESKTRSTFSSLHQVPGRPILGTVSTIRRAKLSRTAHSSQVSTATSEAPQQRRRHVPRKPPSKIIDLRNKWEELHNTNDKMNKKTKNTMIK